jgi:hypothetical protein
MKNLAAPIDFGDLRGRWAVQDGAGLPTFFPQGQPIGLMHPPGKSG